jgi:hypothetical protein
MKNPAIYEGEEVVKLAEITDLPIKHVVDGFCGQFLTAKSLPELKQLYGEAQDALTEAIDETNVVDVFKASLIISSVHVRMTAKIALETPAGTDSRADSEQA